VLGDARRKASRLSLRKLIEDIRRRRNLDVYLTVIVALVVSVLSFFDVVPADKVAALVLAVLAILALTVLATREAVENPRSD
jgi:divalent metal cation (Fe/Co/Zn/Cd) transporter